MKKDGRYRKITKTLFIVIVWLVPIAIYLFLFLVFEQPSLSSLFASQASVSIGVTVIPDDPVKLAPPLQEVAEQPITNTFKSSEYRFITPLEEVVGTTEDKKVVTTPLVTFQGSVIYPYSKVILEIAPEPFFVTTESDAYGHWSWTNYGSPLETGKHSVIVYNFSPIELSGQRSVFVEQHQFMVSGTESDIKPALLSLNKETTVELAGTEYLRSRLLPESKTGFYLFDMKLLDDKLQYKAGEEMTMQFTLVPLQESVPTEASFQHELYYLTDDGSLHERVGLFEDSAVVDISTLVKKFRLKPLASSGTYILKTSVQIGHDVYTKSVLFDIAPQELVTIRGLTIEYKDISRVILWNILFFLLVISLMLTIVAWEYRRSFDISEPIDEETLRAKGYFYKKNN